MSSDKSSGDDADKIMGFLIEIMGLIKDSMIVTANLNKSVQNILSKGFDGASNNLKDAIDLVFPMCDKDNHRQFSSYVSELVHEHMMTLISVRELVDECQREQLEHQERLELLHAMLDEWK